MRVFILISLVWMCGCASVTNTASTLYEKDGQIKFNVSKSMDGGLVKIKKTGKDGISLEAEYNPIKEGVIEGAMKILAAKELSK